MAASYLIVLLIQIPADAGHRVPTMIRWLGKVQPNYVNAKLLSALDWYPTIEALAGYSLDPTVTYDGVDATDALFTDSARY